MRLLSRTVEFVLKQREGSRRHFWGWLNAVFNRVDHERIKAIGPDRAAAEWLLRCGAKVRFEGFERWHHDYNGLPTGPLGRYKIQAIDATESCIMYKGFDYLGRSGERSAPSPFNSSVTHPLPIRSFFCSAHFVQQKGNAVFSFRSDGLKYVEEIKFNKCIYIEDVCLERLSSIENLQASLYMMEVVSCGNVTDKGLVALHRLKNLEYLFLSDLPGLKDRHATVERLQKALPRLDVALDLD